VTPKRRCECGCGKEVVGKRTKRFATRSCQIKARPVLEPLTSNTHLLIPDTQCKEGVPDIHLEWINQYIRDRYEGKALTVVHLGDHWDMPSLSSYDRGKGAMEGRRYKTDVAAGNAGFAKLGAGLEWAGLRKVVLMGNHEERIVRAVESDIQLEGIIGLEQLDTLDWERHDFLEPVDIDGMIYAHYFYQPMTGRPYSGENIELRLKQIGHSFVMGHQQGLRIGMRYVNGRQQLGVVAGSCYLHDEEYKGPQANAHWRGIIILNNVEAGAADLITVSLEYLCRRYEGVRLEDLRT